MTGEMQIVLKLNDEQLFKAVGETVFASRKPIVVTNPFNGASTTLKSEPTDGKAIYGASTTLKLKSTDEKIKDEFDGFQVIKVDAISENGEKGDALVLVKDITISGTTYIKRSIIVIANNGYSVDCKDYFNIIAKTGNDTYYVSAFKEVNTADSACILDTNGNKFLPPRENRLSFDDKHFIINYDEDYTLVAYAKGSYTEKMVGGNDAAPIPSTVKFGNSNNNHFMALEAKSGCLSLTKNQIELTCIPAQNIANLAGK